MTYTSEQFDEDFDLADELDFVCNEFYNTSYEVAARVCNGLGPSWFPEYLRNLLDRMNPTLRPVWANHDIGFRNGDGTWGDFIRKNAAFRINGKLAAKHRYKWYDPRRYWVMKQAAKFAAECDVLGWPAYVAAIRDRQKEEEADV